MLCTLVIGESILLQCIPLQCSTPGILAGSPCPILPALTFLLPCCSIPCIPITLVLHLLHSYHLVAPSFASPSCCCSIPCIPIALLLHPLHPYHSVALSSASPSCCCSISCICIILLLCPLHLWGIPYPITSFLGVPYTPLLHPLHPWRFPNHPITPSPASLGFPVLHCSIPGGSHNTFPITLHLLYLHHQVLHSLHSITLAVSPAILEVSHTPLLHPWGPS